MKIKYLIAILSILFVSFFANASITPSVVLDQNPYSYGVGGEFTAHITQAVGNPYGTPGNYSPLAQVNGGFETFCVETSVDFTPGTKYQFTLNSQDSQGRNLTLGTAYLYAQFAQGILSGYNYTDTLVRQQDAGLLQQAIWYLQGGQTYGGITPTVADNIFYAYALNSLGNNALNPNNDTYGVSIMRLTGDNGTTYQNQLEYTAVPEPGTIWASLFLLLPLGMASFRILKTQKVQ